MILQVKNLNVTFGGEKVLENISFELSAGESMAIIGPNGSGKTTLVKALLGILPYNGEVVWDSNVKIGYVPQKIDLEKNLPLTVRDFLVSRVKIAGLSETEIGRVLQLVLLSENLLDKQLSHLSVGQFQRVAIALALIDRPNLLILDEPTSGVDLPREEEIYETIHRLQDLESLTVIIASHDLNLVYKYAMKVLCINQKAICFGSPQEVLTTERLKELYGSRVYYHHQH